MGLSNSHEMKILESTLFVLVTLGVRNVGAAQNRLMMKPSDFVEDFDCVVECLRRHIKDVIKCGVENDTDEAVDACVEDAIHDLAQCADHICGSHIPDGTCFNECVPPMEDTIDNCEEEYENGNITLPELVQCAQDATDEWERCTAICACQQPWCQACELPENGIKTLYDITIEC